MTAPRDVNVDLPVVAWTDGATAWLTPRSDITGTHALVLADEAARALADVEAENERLKVALAAATARGEGVERDAERLDALRDNSWRLDPFTLPTGAGDADVGWRVIEYHMGKPSLRIVAETGNDDPRAAIDAALAGKGAGSV